MADIHEFRTTLGAARNDREQAENALALERERKRKLAKQLAELNRSFDPHDQNQIAERAKLKEELEKAEANLTELQKNQTSLRSKEKGVFGQFTLVSDPRQTIKALHDQTPILMMPVRLETRFKVVKAVTGAEGTQLWVRIYPDDCWIDTFDPTLTESEVESARTFWIGIWQAGGKAHEDQERAVWRSLVSSVGSGRATWIVSQYEPANAASRPGKVKDEDVILVIPTETALTPIEEPKVLKFWIDSWRADGDPVLSKAASDALKKAVGLARFEEVIRDYSPVNFANPVLGGLTKDQVNVSAAIVVFPKVETKESAWSRSPRINILPERFVFIGYQGKKATLTVLGKPIILPLVAGLDPSAPEEEQLRHDKATGEIVIPDEMKWMTDFDRAVDVGMGFRIPLDATQAKDGFDRVLVLGVRVSSDEQQAKTELETLFRHHSNSRKGFAVVPQGTPTNNTEAVGSGFGRFDDPDKSFDDLKAALFKDEPDLLAKRDGQWIAEYLGIDSMVFRNVHDSDASDQLTARAMNIALWPATFGYWMDSMMSPVFTPPNAEPRDRVIQQTREFFNRYVIGGGAIPAIRIGSQPYGILPATRILEMEWLNQIGANNDDKDDPGFMGHLLQQDPMLGFLHQLYRRLLAIHSEWSSNLSDVSFVDKGGDPHKLLLDIVGLHSGSVEWSQRYAETLETLFNRMNLFGAGLQALPFFKAEQYEQGWLLLLRLLDPGKQFLPGAPSVGIVERKRPPILDKIFSGKHNALKGGIVDDKPLSETDRIRAYAGNGNGKNYIEWLIKAAKTSLNALYLQEGFNDDKVPTALLYILLRHALQLGYDDASIRLHELNNVYSAEVAIRARVDDPFVHIRETAEVSESRYQALYSVQPAISKTLRVHEFIALNIGDKVFARYLSEQLAALEKLSVQPTARLERAFADHIDCCSYRLDAWLLGLVNYQLKLMRELRDGEVHSRKGIYLGAYAWLETLKPENKIFTPVTLQDPELKKEFGQAEPPLMRDSTNEGYIHAPSLNHAVAAAVLRNGFISNASPKNRQTMAVNLTSERVRTALAMLEGIRAGQSLADLLGYQFERGLHDRHNLAEVDKFIFKLRKAFPLRGDKMASTKSKEGVPIEKVEARNVIDGLALAEHIKATGIKTYPFGKKKEVLPDLDNAAQALAINAEADRLVNTHDAVADLALAEGIYQAVLGNYDRVASTYDAYARGNFPPEPDIIRTPLSGIGITHRVALQFEGGANPATSPIPLLKATPRSKGEPALNNWLAKVLPPLDKVGCVVSLTKPLPTGDTTADVTLRDLDLQPSDILAIIREGNEQAMSELDDRIVRHAVNLGARPDHPIKISYLNKGAAPFSIFEILPLVRNIRRLTTRSRPLKPTDLTLANEATSTQDSEPFVDVARLSSVHKDMKDLRKDLSDFQVLLEGPLSDLANRKNEIVTNVDQNLDALVDLLAGAAMFAVVQAGWGFAYDFRRRVFTAILKQASDLVTRWDAKLIEFQAILNAESLLPGTATDEEHFELFLRAEQVISTTATAPLPPTPNALLILINVKHLAFIVKRNQFAAVNTTTRTQLSLLLADVKALLPVTSFDSSEFKLDAHEDEIVRFTEDSVNVLKVIIAELDRRLSASTDLITQQATATASDGVRLQEEAARVLLGADFRIFPEFKLGTDQGVEFENALNVSRSGDLFKHLTNPADPAALADPFPVDTWLYGLARVREKMHAWEQTVMFAGAFGQPEPQLDALQFPFVPDTPANKDRWLGLEFPAQQKLDQDRLLYTVANVPAVFNKAVRQCGMLLDEWTEMIPTADVDTGITLHYDRPNCEAPQAMLLVTPPKFRGAWQWDDLVEALNQTLDFAKRRAIEPRQIDMTAFAPFLPATIMASQISQLTIAANLALNNQVAQAFKK